MSDDETPPTGGLIAPASGSRPAPAFRVIAVVVAVALIALGTTYGVLRALHKESRLDSLVPADSFLFTTIALKPSGDQQRALKSLVSRLPEKQRKQLVPKVEDLLDDALSSIGLSYRKDVKPWAGGQLGMAFSLPDDPSGEPVIVGILTVEDNKAAESALARASSASDQQFAFQVAGGVAYVSDKRAQIEELRSAAERNPLSEKEEYRKALDRVGSDGLVHLWVDSSKLSGLVGAAAPQLPKGLSAGASALALKVTDDGVVVVGFGSQKQGPKGRSGTPDLLEAISEGQLASLTVFDVAAFAGQALEFFKGIAGTALFEAGAPVQKPPESPVDAFTQGLGVDLERDVFPWLHGEFSVIFGGITEQGPEAAAVIEVTDEAAAGRTIDALERSLPAMFGGEGSVASNPQGFDLRSEDFAVSVRRAPGRVVIALPPAYADSLLAGSSNSLAKDAVYRRVIGPQSDKTTAQVFIRIDRLVSAIETFIPAEERSEYERGVAPYLRLFKALGMRVTASKDETLFRMFISLTEK